MEPSLRPTRADDLDAVLALLEASDLPTAGVDEAFGHFVVAEAGDVVVAVAGMEVHGADGILRSVAVDPAFQGRGLGRSLTHAVIDAARRAGLRRLYLLTTTAETYFPRLGFRPIDRDGAPEGIRRSVEFRDACPASAVAMALDLDDGAPAGGWR